MSSIDVERAFQRLAQAVALGDLATYETLAADPRDKFQRQLFERNSAMIKKAGMRLEFDNVLVSGERATVSFKVLSPVGQHVEQGEMTFVRDGAQWKVVEL